MKFTGILRSQSTQEQLLLTTEPPLTTEVFERFLERIREEFRSEFALIDGRLSYKASPDFGAGAVRDFEQLLTEVSDEIERAKKRAQQNRETFLERIAKQSGLPLQDDPPAAEPVGDSK